MPKYEVTAHGYEVVSTSETTIVEAENEDEAEAEALAEIGIYFDEIEDVEVVELD